MELNNISNNRLVPIYLMSSYLYYECDLNVLEDTQFDYLCKKILDNWDNIDHMHKHLLDKETLKAGSGYGIEYTNLIMSASLDWYKQHERKSNEEKS
jgi:hypothetical protein